MRRLRSKGKSACKTSDITASMITEKALRDEYRAKKPRNFFRLTGKAFDLISIGGDREKRNNLEFD